LAGSDLHVCVDEEDSSQEPVKESVPGNKHKFGANN
jgi:hypothetical protein